MRMAESTTQHSPTHIRVSRLKGLTRGAVWLVISFVLGAATYLVFHSVDWSFSAVSSRLVTVSMVFFGLPLAMGALLTAFFGSRWFALAVWPAGIGVHADPLGLQLRLGPFGSSRCDSARIEVRYPFELAEKGGDGGFEAYLPVEEQMDRFLPRIVDRVSGRRLDLVILRFAAGTESEVARQLRGIVAVWRAHRSPAPPEPVVE